MSGGGRGEPRDIPRGPQAMAERWFYPATCHPPLTRRQLLLGSGAALTAGLLGGAATDALAAAGPGDGTAIVERYATYPDDPWAVAHGIRAMGRNFTIKGGRRAVDYLLENALISVPANTTHALAFPPDVEVHPNAFLAEGVLEPGVSVQHAFTHQGSRRTVGDVVNGARALFRPSLVISVPNALPWSLIALTRTTPPARREWTNAWSEPVDLDAVVESAMQLLERASLPIAEAMREGRPEVDKAPVHSFTCGGTHMVYALLTAVNAGYTGKDRRQRVQRQVDLLVWRLGADVDLMDRFYRAGTADPIARWYELDSKLKLLGHAEECLAFAARHGVVTLTADQQARRRHAVATLRTILVDLEKRSLDEARTINLELYKQLVGDACHARHGLTLV